MSPGSLSPATPPGSSIVGIVGGDLYKRSVTRTQNTERNTPEERAQHTHRYITKTSDELYCAVNTPPVATRIMLNY